MEDGSVQASVEELVLTHLDMGKSYARQHKDKIQLVCDLAAKEHEELGIAL
ncbi:hypothetical protein AURDEDRAFT_165771 [Auricularia subglabra TFB-10046 SS5]|nr:hypothetical protein AURDEDRAFT_165771 [Auricularia subglabra TFB-10046 SS5]